MGHMALDDAEVGGPDVGRAAPGHWVGGLQPGPHLVGKAHAVASMRDQDGLSNQSVFGVDHDKDEFTVRAGPWGLPYPPFQ